MIRTLPNSIWIWVPIIRVRTLSIPSKKNTVRKHIFTISRCRQNIFRFEIQWENFFMLFWKRCIGQSRQRNLFENGQAKDILKQVNLNSMYTNNSVHLSYVHIIFKDLLLLVKISTPGKRFWNWAHYNKTVF